MTIESKTKLSFKERIIQFGHKEDYDMDVKCDSCERTYPVMKIVMRVINKCPLLKAKYASCWVCRRKNESFGKVPFFGEEEE